MATKVILLTMVKNEEANMKRLITSVKSWIDGVVICDTGSTDNTIQVSKDTLEEFKIPGRIYQYPWENFGVSRSKSFECFKDWVTRFTEWDPNNVYALLLDADMVLSEEGDLKLQLSNKNESYGGFNLQQKNSGLIYENTRLLRASAPWKCIGYTHEYWGCDGKQTGSFKTPIITDIGDGGCKADKYPRDARLLEDELKEKPDNVRTLFYLGQTYMSLGRNDDAIRVLSRRIELGGWEEEIYISHLYKGDCLRNTGKIAEGIQEWLKAWQLRQHRTEAALRLISYYRQTPKMNFIAYTFLEKLFQVQYGETVDGKEIAKPIKHNDILFVSSNDMRYQIWEELGIIAYYAGGAAGARHRLDLQVMSSNLNFNERNRILDFYKWYRLKMPVVKRQQIILTANDVPFFADGYWKPFNPCIRREADRYVISMRTANYETNNAQHYTYRGQNGYIITRNVIADLGSNFEILHDRREPMEIVIPNELVINRTTNIHGVEDCRWLGTNSVIATTRQFGQTDTNRMARVDFDYDTRSVTKITPLTAPVMREDTECQKNWLPFIWNDQEVYIYRINPFTVFTTAGEKVLEWTSPGLVTLDGMRGSAAPSAWSSEKQPSEALIIVAHFSHYGGDGRHYYHRFITLGADLKPIRISKIFMVADEPIQYVAGMCQSLTPGNYAISYGVNDSQAWVVEVEKTVIEDLLFYVL
jgi:glycosyltransferase involved in cell wall biosynthesis